ncbi:MAG TPA: 16S rRNA (guanine(966)-N(2))-methyltransferase RsmD [Clostridiaceae bacterium]|nr:16S rRNA (guanine(966)-N(2))-methyltransferase RsmD [Clostridiaceae bacterium]
MTRIISGKAKGTNLASFKDGSVKPTSGRTKEALFSIVFSKGIRGSFLDLFSGSGQIGLEAASRGFSPVVMVEKSKRAQKIIRENIARTKMSADVILIGQAAEQAVKKLADSGAVFDIIYMDPPWVEAEKSFYQMQEQLARIMTPDGLLVFEHEKRIKAPDTVTVLEHLQSCNYGSAMLSFYKRK